MNTNILYLTTRCNLKCSYCYENQAQNKKNINLSFSDIDKFIENMYNDCIRNGIKNSMLCLMGGEPLLEFDKITHIYNKTIEYKKLYNFDIFLNLITNGTLFEGKYDVLSKIFNYKNQGNILKISYDGSFQYKRTSSYIVVNTLDELNRRNIPFGISYTVTKDNFEKEILCNDIIILIMKYYKDIISNKSLNDNRIRRFRLNFNQAELRPLYPNYDERIEELKKYCDCIYLKFGVPVCYMSCDTCSYCVQDTNSKINYLIPTKNKAKVKTQDRQAVQGFNHF